MDNRMNTLSILRIGHFAPKRDLGSKGGFEMASRVMKSYTMFKNPGEVHPLALKSKP